MYGPPQTQTPKEIKEKEAAASATVMQFIAASSLLYLSPYAITALKGVIGFGKQ